MTDTQRPIAVDEPESGAILTTVVYDRKADVAVIGYTNGDRVIFADCSRYTYGLCLIAEENADGSFGTTFSLMDDGDVDIHLLTALGRQEKLETDDEIRSGFARIRTMLDRSYLTIGVPATFRRLRRFILPHVHALPAEMLASLAPHSISREIISRLEVGDHPFKNSEMLKYAR